MFAFILIVTITLHAADSPPRSFIFKSDDQYNPQVCERRAEAAAERIEQLLSGDDVAKVEVQHSCVRLETRNI